MGRKSPDQAEVLFQPLRLRRLAVCREKLWTSRPFGEDQSGKACRQSPLCCYDADLVLAALDGGELVGYFNLAWFAWGSPETNLGDTVEYNTLVRVTSPYDRLATAVVKLFVHYNVRMLYLEL